MGRSSQRKGADGERELAVILRGLEWKTVATLIGGGKTTHSIEVRARRHLEGHHVK